MQELKINPREYFDDVMRRLLRHNSQKLTASQSMAHSQAIDRMIIKIDFF
jgi:hypothetical protein